MKLFVLAMLALACLEGFYCAPFLELFIPKRSSINYRSKWSADVPNVIHVGGQREFDWDREWEKPIQRRRFRRPPPDTENNYPDNYQSNYPSNYPTSYPGNYPYNYQNYYPQYQSQTLF